MSMYGNGKTLKISCSLCFMKAQTHRRYPFPPRRLSASNPTSTLTFKTSLLLGLHCFLMEKGRTFLSSQGRAILALPDPDWCPRSMACSENQVSEPLSTLLFYYNKYYYYYHHYY